jgi:hypothetical protein
VTATCYNSRDLQHTHSDNWVPHPLKSRWMSTKGRFFGCLNQGRGNQTKRPNRATRRGGQTIAKIVETPQRVHHSSPCANPRRVQRILFWTRRPSQRKAGHWIR